MFKNIGNMMSMLRQAQEVGGKIKQLGDQLRTEQVEASAGGGMVRVVANGASEIVKIEIDPTLIERNEREMIEDLTTAAVNEALAKAKQLHAEAMQNLTGDMNVPGLDEAMSKMTGEE